MGRRFPTFGDMPLIDTLIAKDILPDSVLRWGIRRLLRQRLRDERPDEVAARFAKVDAFAAELRTLPVAIEIGRASCRERVLRLV